MRVGKDFTLHAKCDGKVQFSKDHVTGRTYVNVDPLVKNRLPSPRKGSFTLENVTKFVARDAFLKPANMINRARNVY